MENFVGLGESSNFSSSEESNWSFIRNSSNNSKDEVGGELNFTNSEQLPIDMKFNDGHLLSIIGYSALLLVSAIGNVSVGIQLIRIWKRQGRLTPVNFLLVHLTIADLLVTFIMMPIEIAWNATVAWQAGDFLCRFFSFLRIFGLYLSGFIIMCISLDRYYAFVHPLSITGSKIRCRYMVIIAWISSFLCSLPQSIIFHVETHPRFTWYQQCITFNSFPNPDWELAYNYFGFAFLYAVPLITIFICYLCIVWTIWRLNSRKRRQDGQLRRSTVGSLERAKSRTLKMTVLIVSTFFLCWTPYNIMCLWYWLDPQSAQGVDQRVQKGLFLFACTNSCVNPLIYGLFHFSNKNKTEAVIKYGTSFKVTEAYNTMRVVHSSTSLRQQHSVVLQAGH